MSYYEHFLQEIKEEILKFLPVKTLLETTMKRIDGICKTYGIDWKLEFPEEKDGDGLLEFVKKGKKRNN